MTIIPLIIITALPIATFLQQSLLKQLHLPPVFQITFLFHAWNENTTFDFAQSDDFGKEQISRRFLLKYLFPPKYLELEAICIGSLAGEIWAFVLVLSFGFDGK